MQWCAYTCTDVFCVRRAIRPAEQLGLARVLGAGARVLFAVGGAGGAEVALACGAGRGEVRKTEELAAGIAGAGGIEAFAVADDDGRPRLNELSV